MQKANKGELSNLKNKLLAEQVQEQIYQYILETPIAVGAKLPNEFELGDRFSVGRSTIREAVKLFDFQRNSGSQERIWYVRGQHYAGGHGPSGPGGGGGQESALALDW